MHGCIKGMFIHSGFQVRLGKRPPLKTGARLANVSSWETLAFLGDATSKLNAHVLFPSTVKEE